MEALESKKVLVCAGSGGVGKTTMSASLALKLAKNGKSVLVMTIDPAKRLVTALGLEGLPSEAKFIKSFDSGGKLFASVIQPQIVFDRFVKKASKDEQEANRILKNRLYQKLSRRLGGSQEFTSLQMLYDNVKLEQFDVIILDTPPAKHARDFLSAPRKFFSLFDESVLDWFVQDSKKFVGFMGLFKKGSLKAISILERLVGKSFLEEMIEFFSAVHHISPSIRETSMEVQKILSSKTTGFILVTSFDEVKLQEAKSFYKSLRYEAYNLEAVIVNRAFPIWEKGSEIPNEILDAKEQQFFDYYSKYSNYFSRQQKNYDQFQQELDNRIKFLRVADMGKDIYNLDALEELCQFLNL